MRGREIDLNSMFLLTIAGTRSASTYGIALAESFGRDAALSGTVLVSGLTRGIDERSAEACIGYGGSCIGVLGTVIDSSDSKGLYDKIIRNGLLVSEYAPGAKTLAANFRARNRILAGLSSALCIVEAPEKAELCCLQMRRYHRVKRFLSALQISGQKAGRGQTLCLKTAQAFSAHFGI